MIEPGTLVDKYRIHSLLGDGGMGAVYYGEHVVLGRPAAVKVLHPHIATRTELVHRFVNEARIAARLDHRNIVDVLDCGMFPSEHAPNARWYIALEFLRGKSLGSFLAERGGPIDLPTILHIIGETCNGLHAAHEADLVHRDIKPDNLYITQAEDDPLRVVILDFGIAKLNQPDSGVQTHSQMGMGTPAYAAPEQLRDAREVDRRADIFALGVLVHEMATGVRPWGTTNSIYEIIAQHSAMTAAPNPRRLRPDLPQKWCDVVARAMEPDPRRRWPTARDFARALAEATPMPFSANGMSVLETYAKELTKGSTHSLTVGRVLPPELVAQPPAFITKPERASPRVEQPLTVSDGVPRNGTAPLHNEPARPLSTIAGSSGQSIPEPPASPRSRWPMLAAIALAVAALVAAVVAVMSRGDDAPSGRDTRPTAATTADAARMPDAGAASSALAIISEPTGAEIFVDGVSKGAAPVNLQLEVGVEVEVRADLAGFASARESTRIAATPGTLRLELSRIVDAGVVPDALVPKSGKPSKTPKPKRGARDAGAGKTGGSGFNPDDVL